MKVWQWMDYVKQSDASEQEIEAWFLMNGLSPCDLIVKNENDPMGEAHNALHLEDELPSSILNLVRGKYYETIEVNALRSFLEEKINEKEN